MELGQIRTLCEKRVGGMRKLASDIGMSEANLHRCVNNNKIQAADLEKIALLLKVNIGTFFDEAVSALANNSNATANGDGSVAVSGNNNSHVIAGNETALLKERIKYLEQLLKEKERLINILMERK